MPDIGLVDLQLEILEKQLKFYNNPATSDVTFLIGNETLVAHRFPLAAQSDFFQVLLYGENYMESGQRDVRLEVPFNAMKMLLEFVYTGKIDLRSHPLPDVAKLLELAHRYQFESLEKAIAKYLYFRVTPESVCAVLEIAFMVDYLPLIERCWTTVEMVVEGIYNIEIDLSYALLVELLDRKPRIVSEVKLFQFSHELVQKPTFCTQYQRDAIFSKIEFSKMSIEQLFEVVKPTGVLNGEKLCNIIAQSSLYKVKPLEKDVSNTAVVLIGKDVEFLFQEGVKFTTPDEKENCIMVDLTSLYLVNTISFNKSLGFVRYYIEVSASQETWVRVVDYSNYSCRDYQNLHFSEAIVRFIKIVLVSGKLECNCLKIKFIQNPPKFLGGFICPETNVATPQKAFAYNRSSLKPYNPVNQLLNGNFVNQGIGTPYTSHTTGDGDVLIQFKQPYLLSSCQFLLWDDDGRKYSYKVEAVSDLNKSEVISDKSNELLRGWQIVNFAARSIVSFRITGIKSTLENEFRLVHFEAPAQTIM